MTTTITSKWCCHLTDGLAKYSCTNCMLLYALCYIMIGCSNSPVNIIIQRYLIVSYYLNQKKINTRECFQDLFYEQAIQAVGRMFLFT